MISAPREHDQRFGYANIAYTYMHVHTHTAIDVWSAGVVLLSLLSKQFPFFNSTDDQDAIVEIACIFGSRPMEKCAARYDRRWSTNLPGVPPAPVCSLDKLCFRYNVLLKETIALGAMGEHAPPEDVSSLTDDPNDTADTRERKKNARIVNKLAQEFFSATHHSHSTKESVDAMAESAPAALGPCLRRAAREYLDLFDLLKRLLALHHVDRITAAKCMEHPFLRKSTGQQ